jgi:hypothetical protein
MSQVQDLLKDIKDNLSQQSASAKDEERVMRAMLNDKEYAVNVYDKSGVVGTFCPSQSAREMCASVIASSVGVTKDEAAKIMDDHTFKKSEAQAMVDISKEFINTYIETGRKLPLGGRETSNVFLSKKEVKEGFATYPKKVGIAPDGQPIYENGKAPIKPHTSIKVQSKTPSWL